MVNGNPPARMSQLFGHLDVLLGTYLKHLAANDTGQSRPVGHRHTDQYTLQSFSAGERNQDQQNRVGNSHYQVDHPVNKMIQPGGAGSCRNTHNQRNHRTDARRHSSHHNTHREAFDGPHQHVSSQHICPKGMLQRRLQGFL